MVVLRPALGLADDDLLAKGLAPREPREAVARLHEPVSDARLDQPRADLPHQPPVQELMVHVHQVLVHERVVAADAPIEDPQAVIRIVVFWDVWQGRCRRLLWIAAENPNETAGLARGIGAHPVQPRAGLVKVGKADATTGAVIGPAVIIALQPLPLHHARVQRHLAVGATVLQRKDLARTPAHEHDGRPRQPRSRRALRLHGAGALHRHPVIEVETDPAQIRLGARKDRLCDDEGVPGHGRATQTPALGFSRSITSRRQRAARPRSGV